MECYLNQVRSTWNSITDEDDTVQIGIDISTVKLLEGRCPSDPRDRAFIESQRHDIFPTIHDPHQREQIWRRIMSIDHLIPSLYTFLEDTKYLEVCAKVVKKLLPPRIKGTIHQAFSQLHSGQKQFSLQKNEHQCVDREELTPELAHWKAYRQLWLFGMRHFPEMIGHTPRTEDPKSKVCAPGSEYLWWHGLAELAKSSGYHGVQVQFTSELDAEKQMIGDFLRRIRPAAAHQQEVAKFDQTSDRIVAVLRDWAAVASPEGTRDPIPCSADLSHRCGVPFWPSFQHDRYSLFLGDMYETTDCDAILTTIKVKRTTFHSFFGQSYPQGSNDYDELEDVSMTPNVPSHTDPGLPRMQSSHMQSMENTTNSEPQAGNHSTDMRTQDSEPVVINTGSSALVTQQPQGTKSHAQHAAQPQIRHQGVRSAPSYRELREGIPKLEVPRIYEEYVRMRQEGILYIIKENPFDGHFRLWECDYRDKNAILEFIDIEAHQFPVPGAFKKMRYQALKNVMDANPFVMIIENKDSESSHVEADSERSRKLPRPRPPPIVDEEDLGEIT